MDIHFYSFCVIFCIYNTTFDVVASFYKLVLKKVLRNKKEA